MTEVKQELTRHLDVLCNEIGERHVGSDGEHRAADYIAETFERAGHHVEREAFDAPGWTYGAYGLEVVDTGQTIPCFPCFYSNACDVAGEMVVVEPGNLGNCEVQGRICFAPSLAAGGSVHDRNEFAERLDAMGAAALIVAGPYHDTVNTKIVRTPHLKQMAVVCTDGNTVWDIAQNLDRRVRLTIEAQTTWVSSSNVVARVLGPSGRKAVVGAHYDTAPGTMGAGDNASGTAILLELARMLEGKTADYSVDFVAFAAEEYGGPGCGLGSFEYVARHKDELRAMQWMCNIDDVGIAFGKEAVAVGRPWRLRTAIDKIVRPYGLTTGGPLLASDDCIFHYNAIPTAYFHQDYSHFLRHQQIHSPNDTLTTLSIGGLVTVCEAACDVLTHLFALDPEQI